ncbi:putative gp11 [Burkholderia pseudomallei MSHR5492]|nr:putative gp11 [Burkholderia pseudomallei MSHR5492]
MLRIWSKLRRRGSMCSTFLLGSAMHPSCRQTKKCCWQGIARSTQRGEPVCSA